MEEVLDDVRDEEPFLINTHVLTPQTRSSTEANASTIEILHHRPFPLITDLLEYPAIRSLEETDALDSDTDTRLEEYREAIEAHVLKWRIDIENYLAGLIRQGRASDGLEPAPPAPTLFSRNSNSNLLDGFSDDLKLLLRADSIFTTDSGFPFTYDRLLASTHSDESGRPIQRPVDFSGFKRHERAQEVARALLAGIGQPDASFLELRSDEERLFKCGGCQCRLRHPWEDLVSTFLVAHVFLSLTLVCIDSTLRSGASKVGQVPGLYFES